MKKINVGKKSTLFPLHCKLSLSSFPAFTRVKKHAINSCPLQIIWRNKGHTHTCWANPQKKSPGCVCATIAGESNNENTENALETNVNWCNDAAKDSIFFLLFSYKILKLSGWALRVFWIDRTGKLLAPSYYKMDFPMEKTHLLEILSKRYVRAATWIYKVTCFDHHTEFVKEKSP